MPDPVTGNALHNPVVSTAATPAAPTDPAGQTSRTSAARRPTPESQALASSHDPATLAALEIVRTLASEEGAAVERELGNRLPFERTRALASRPAASQEAAQTANSTGVDHLLERFTDGAARHPLELAPARTTEASGATAASEASPESVEAREFARLNPVLSAHVKAPARDAAELGDTLRAISEEATGMHSSAQSVAVMHFAAHVQTAAERFSDERAQLLVGNDLYGALLETAAAGTTEALDKARGRTSELLQKLDTFVKSGDAEEIETARVLREAIESLADGKAEAVQQNDRTLLRPDGSADLTLEDATFAPDACGHLATKDLDARRPFGTISPVADARDREALRIDRTVTEAEVAVATGDTEAACEASRDLARLNRAAACAMEPALTDLGCRTGLETVPGMLGIDPTCVPDGASPREAGEALGAAADWSALCAAHGTALQTLETAVDGVMDAYRLPSGEIDPDRFELLRPVATPQSEMLAHALLQSPYVAAETRDEAVRLLEGVPANAPARDRARVAHEALVLLRNDLARTAAKNAGATAAAEQLLGRYGIDDANPRGGVRGGLEALTARLAFNRFAPETGPDGRVSSSNLPPAVLGEMTEKLAAGFESESPELAQALRDTGSAFVNARTESERKAAFEAVKTLLTVAASVTSWTEATDLYGADLAQTITAGIRGTSTANGTSGTAPELLARTRSALTGNAANRTALERIGVLAERLGELNPAERASFKAVTLACDYLGALAYNDGYARLLAGAAAPGTPAERLTLADFDPATHPEVAALSDAARAFAENPTSDTLLDFHKALRATDPEALRAALAEKIDSALAGLDPATDAAERAAVETRLRDDLTYLTGQFEILQSSTDVLFYGAHALYALETGLADPANVRSDAPENAAFLAKVETLPAGTAGRCRALMRDGIRGESRNMATCFALASLRATAEHLGRRQVIATLGGEADLNIGRALRRHAALTGGSTAGATPSEPADLATLTARFREATAALPILQNLAKSVSGDVMAARSVANRHLEQRMSAIGVTPEEVARIENGVDLSEPAVDAAKTASMLGQTAGMGLLVLDQALLNDIDDFAPEVLADLIGGTPHTRPQSAQGVQGSQGTRNGYYDLTLDELRRGILEAASRPLYERECAVLLNAFMKRAGDGGLPLSYEAALKALAPTPPSPESLLGLTEDDRSTALENFALEAERFALAAPALRHAYESQAASTEDVRAGRASLVCASESDAAAVLEAVRKPALDKTLMQGSVAGTKDDRVKTAWSNLAAELACGPSETLSARKRELFSAVTAQRFNRGRYVLLSKVADTGNPSATAAFERALRKLPRNATPESVLRPLERAARLEFGEFARLKLAGDGTVGTLGLSEQLGTLDADSRLALVTACHGAMERTAASLGKSVDALALTDSKWSGVHAVQSVTSDKPAVRALLESRGPEGTVTTAELMRANLEEFLPASTASAYVDALLLNDASGAAAASRAVFGRNRILRTTKYFEGLLADIRSSAQLSDLRAQRTMRTTAIRDRQRLAIGACLAQMEPGASIAIDKTGHLKIIGTSLEIGETVSKSGTKNKVGASLGAELGADFSDGVLFTKGADGFVTVSVAKAAGLTASASAGASAGTSREAGSAQFGLNFEASASASLSVDYAFTIQNRLPVRECSFFIDRMISGELEARDLNRATVSHHAGLAIEISAGISAALELGFESDDETDPATVTTRRTLEDGSVETTETLRKDRSSSSSVTIESPDGTETERTREAAWSAPLSEEPEVKFEEFGSSSASASVSISGAVSGSRTVCETPTTRETQYAFSGEVKFSAEASVSQTALEVAAGLANGELPSVEKAAAVRVDNTYTRVDSLTSGRTVGATKSTVCTFTGETPEERLVELERTVRAQRLAPDQARALTTLALLSGLEPASVAFESHADLPEQGGKLRKRDLFGAAYHVDTVMLGFSENRTTSSILTRFVNLAGRAFGEAVEFSTNVTHGTDVTIDVSALTRITPERAAELLEADRLSSLEVREHLQ